MKVFLNGDFCEFVEWKDIIFFDTLNKNENLEENKSL